MGNLASITPINRHIPDMGNLLSGRDAMKKREEIDEEIRKGIEKGFENIRRIASERLAIEYPFSAQEIYDLYVQVKSYYIVKAILDWAIKNGTSLSYSASVFRINNPDTMS